LCQCLVQRGSVLRYGLIVMLVPLLAVAASMVQRGRDGFTQRILKARLVPVVPKIYGTNHPKRVSFFIFTQLEGLAFVPTCSGIIMHMLVLILHSRTL
jgi:hypothetical protein